MSPPHCSVTTVAPCRRSRHFTVVPRLPVALERLRDIAYNLWWSWAPVAHELFVRIDPDLWEEVHGNPIELLARVDQGRLEELAGDDAFTSHLDAAWTTFQRYMQREGWFSKTFPEAAGARIAYFSMEYGLHECLPIYSGGLGVLAGDHLKTASDLGLPLVGVGLAYAEGYFRQVARRRRLAERALPHQRLAPHAGPAGPRRDRQAPGHPRAVPARVVLAQLWKVQVGRVPLLLLDANLEENAPNDRSITGPLYGGDQEFRVRQEIMLGIGGTHALEAVGLSPTVCHMNEGHSAFLAVERIGRVMREKHVSFAVAAEANSAGNIFTTHTPVPAGNDAFDPHARPPLPRAVPRGARHRRRRSCSPSAASTRATARRRSRCPSSRCGRPTTTTASASCTARSRARCGKASGPTCPSTRSPSTSSRTACTRPRGSRARWGRSSRATSARAGPSSSTTRSSGSARTRSRTPSSGRCTSTGATASCSTRAGGSTARPSGAGRGARSSTLADEVLDPHALTIGFARRFATYKRAALLFTDLARVKKLLGDTERPVQLVFAGKAHPQDKGGKELIRSIIHASRDAGLRGRVVFVEDYDMRIARALVSGVDVWLNTPRRPLEASGTSGMKAAANGALGVSVLDGWFAEAWRDHGWEIGWAIGRGEEYPDGTGDAREAELLYDLLEREVVPLFYAREGMGELPRGWIKRMKNSIAKLVPQYNTARMVRQYTARFYVPAIKLTHKLTDGDLAAAKALTAWKDRVRERVAGRRGGRRAHRLAAPRWPWASR